MPRSHVLLVMVVLVLVLIAVGIQRNRSITDAPLAAAPAATPTATGTATPPQPTATPTLAVVVPNTAPANCPITRPPNPPFVPPPFYPARAPYGEFWYGTEALWTALHPDGTWRRLPLNPGGYTQKVFLWKVGYNGYAEPQPEITVTGKRLDAPTPLYTDHGGTNAYHPDFGGWAMLTGVEIPSLGCWELTFRHAGHQLTFVVWIAP